MKAHGEISLLWKDNILIIQASGPFNEIGLQNCISRVQKSVLAKNLPVWRKIEIWDSETLGSPSVIAIAQRASQWYKMNGCYASAIVVSNSIQNYIVEKITANGSKTFYNQTEALLWLNTQSA